MKNNEKEEKIEKQKSKIKKLREDLRELQSETKRTTKSLITSSFAFVAALFWRDALQSLLGQIFGVMPGEGLWFIQMVVAIVITMFVVIVTFSLSKI